jgi:hypothetical protein
MLYLLAALALPGTFGEGTVDLRANYFRHARWFFGSFVTVLLVSIMKSVVIDGSLPGPFDLGFHLFWIAGATTAAATRSDLFPQSVRLRRGVSFNVYIGAHLRRAPLRDVGLCSEVGGQKTEVSDQRIGAFPRRSD